MSLGAENPDHLQYRAKGSKKDFFLRKNLDVFFHSTNILALDLPEGKGTVNNQPRGQRVKIVLEGHCHHLLNLPFLMKVTKQNAAVTAEEHKSCTAPGFSKPSWARSPSPGSALARTMLFN